MRTEKTHNLHTDKYLRAFVPPADSPAKASVALPLPWQGRKVKQMMSAGPPDASSVLSGAVERQPAPDHDRSASWSPEWKESDQTM